MCSGRDEQQSKDEDSQEFHIATMFFSEKKVGGRGERQRRGATPESPGGPARRGITPDRTLSA